MLITPTWLRRAIPHENFTKSKTYAHVSDGLRLRPSSEFPSAHNNYRGSMQNDIASCEPVRAAGLEEAVKQASAETIDHLHYIMVLRGKPPLSESAKERTREALVRLLQKETSREAQSLIICVMRYFDI